MAKGLLALTHLADWHDRLPRYAFAASLVADKTVLDLGCSTGDGSRLLAEAGARLVVGIDPSSAMIDAARGRHQLENLRFMARFVEDPLDFGIAGDPADEANIEFEARQTITQMVAAEQPPASASLEAALKEAPVEKAPAGDDESGSIEIVEDAVPEDVPAEDVPSEPSEPSEDMPSEPGDGPVDEDAAAAASVSTEDGHEAENSEQRNAVADPSLDPDVSAAWSESDDDSEGSLDHEDEVETGELDLDAHEVPWEEPRQYDVILALNPILPVADPAFLARLGAMLSPGGFILAAVRLSGDLGIADLLASFEPDTDSGEPVGFVDIDSMREVFGRVFTHSQEVAQYSTLQSVFAGRGDEPPDQVDRAGIETIPRYRLVMLANEELPSVTGLAFDVLLEPIVAKLTRGVESLVLHALNQEHRNLVYEEQLSQKDALIDDLEREVRSVDGQRRELAGMVHGLQTELDSLQEELIWPPLVPEPELPDRSVAYELEMKLSARDEQLGFMQERIDHSRSMIDALRETVQAQRLTILALSGKEIGGVEPPHLTDFAESEIEAPSGISLEAQAEADEARQAAESEASRARAEAESLRLEVERLSAEANHHQLTISDLQVARTDLEQKLGRFVRGRRQKRSGLLAPDGPPSKSGVDGLFDEPGV